MSTSETWSDLTCCPFCGDAITSPGAGFIDHTAESRACESSFNTWRGRVRDDVSGGWGG